jgi:hypothetical protein
MFAVLDGEATPEESRELTRLLADNEAAREEYDSLRRLFERLRSVPPLDAPQDLAGAALDRRLRNAPPERRSRSSGSSKTRRGNMSPNRSKQLIWMGGGIAVAAVVAVAFLTIDYPPDSRKTAGTVAPAQRYRAEQPKAGDVKLGDQAVAQLMQTEAFDRFVKDPSTRALALDPDFQALAKLHADGLAALAAHPDAVPIVAAKAKALTNAQTNATVAQAKALTNAQANALTNAQANALTNAQANALTNAQANALTNAQANAIADAQVFAKFGAEANALAVLARSPQTAQVLGRYNDAVVVAAKSQTFAALVTNASFPQALAASTAANAAANSTSTNAQEK